MLTGGARSAAWTSFDKVESITRATNTVCFAYDSEHERIKMEERAGTDCSATLSQTTWYVNGPGVHAEKVVAGATTTWRNFLFVGGLMVGQRDTVVSGSTTIQYFVLDHLGSVAVVTDSSGALQTNGRRSYDAWGNPRLTNGSDGTPAASPTTRGFTGHEMIASVGLVNMNGRVYDSFIGRFMSADPVTETVFMLQVLNKYTYVGNNPLSYTDMTGYSYLRGKMQQEYAPGQNPFRCYQADGCPASPGLFEQIVKVVAIIGASFVCGPFGPLCGAAAAGIVTGLQGGDLRDVGDAFALTLVSATVLAGVGGQYGGSLHNGVPPTTGGKYGDRSNVPVSFEFVVGIDLIFIRNGGVNGLTQRLVRRRTSVQMIDCGIALGAVNDAFGAAPQGRPPKDARDKRQLNLF